MNWKDKSRDSDLFFCNNADCNVITFRTATPGRNVCPKCFAEGSLVRRRDTLMATEELSKRRASY